MCDYSLEMYRSRPARAGERYTTSSFPSGSIGLTAPEDCRTAVCLMVDTRLKLEGISEQVQRTYGLAPSEEAVFVRREQGPHHDAVRFANGSELLLQQLGVGVGVTVIDALEGGFPLKREHRKEPELV